METIFWIVGGIVALLILVRVVIFIGGFVVEGAEIARELNTESLRKQLSDPGLSANELQEIAYVTREDAGLIYEALVQHPNIYPELVVWLDEVALLTRQYKFDAVTKILKPPTP